MVAHVYPTRDIGSRSGAWPCLVLAILNLGGCGRDRDTAELALRYSQARCLPRVQEDEFSKSNRVWRARLTLADGSEVVIHSFQAPGGQVEIEALPSRERFVAIRPPDYIYPDDVRYDPSTGLLYVRAAGVRAIGRNETILYAYSIAGRALRSERIVKPEALPPLCE